jgi:hypothetical protein
MTVRPVLAALFLLSGCAAHQARQAQQSIVRGTMTDAEQCMGLPSQPAQRLPDGTTIAQWTYVEPPSTSSIPLAEIAMLPISLPLALTGSLSIGSSGYCTAIARADASGRLISFRYAGRGDGIGHDALCAALVRGCLRDYPAPP